MFCVVVGSNNSVVAKGIFIFTITSLPENSLVLLEKYCIHCHSRKI